MRIRRYDPADAQALSDLYRRSVTELGAREYQARQVEVWADLAPSARLLSELKADGRARLVAEADGRAVGFIDVKPDGHIHYLYRAPEAPKGAADLLYAEAEAWARNQGVRRLFAEASEAARRFFERRGFVVTARRDFEVSGVPIHNYAVEKYLP